MQNQCAATKAIEWTLVSLTPGPRNRSLLAHVEVAF